MHALEQLQSERYSLWTGCLGTALYLADCVDSGGMPPMPVRASEVHADKSLLRLGEALLLCQC